MSEKVNDRELLNLSSEEKVLIIRKLQEALKNARVTHVDMNILLAYETGWNEAVAEAAEIAQSMHDDYNRDDPYCQGICDASSGIAWRIKELKK